MSTDQILTLVIALLAHAGWLTALLHSIQTRKAVTPATPPKP